MERRLAHLQMIQTVISRMAANSFHVKGWSITLVAALFALAAVDDINEFFVYLTYFPVFMFWVLDAYFLRQERLFREVYDHVRALDEAQIDFSMDTKAFEKSVGDVGRVAWSPTLRLFHGTLTCATVVVTILMIVL